MRVALCHSMSIICDISYIGSGGAVLHCGSDDDRRCRLFSSSDLGRLEHDERLQSLVRVGGDVTSDDVCTVVVTPPVQSHNITTSVYCLSLVTTYTVHAVVRSLARALISRFHALCPICCNIRILQS